VAIILRQRRLTHGYNTPFFDSLVDAASFLALEPTDEKSAPHSEAPGSLPSDSSSEQTSNANSQPFDKLLAALSPDREKAGEEYELIRRKLYRFFEWRGCDAGDRLTDEAFERVTRKLDEGHSISNIKAYFYTVAKFLYLEWLKELKAESLDDDDPPDLIENRESLDEDEVDPRERCFDECLAEISEEDRDTILEYYTSEKREKIERRMRLAQKLDISQNALRIRVHRIRKDLEECVKKRLGGET
jgi:RNA polymerase sigma factor (sigma-70 family)